MQPGEIVVATNEQLAQAGVRQQDGLGGLLPRPVLLEDQMAQAIDGAE